MTLTTPRVFASRGGCKLMPSLPAGLQGCRGRGTRQPSASLAILGRMSHCDRCGAPLARTFESQATCTFCDSVNAPLQRQVEVAVPVQLVQKVVQVVGASSPEAVEERCPHCRKRLVSVVAKGVELAGCGGCGGIWIDNASARQVLSSPEAIFADLARRAGNNARSRRPRERAPVCPVCPAVLDRVVTRGIELDVCGEHGTWFDAFELAALVDAVSGRTPVPMPLGDTRTVHCATCRREITAGRANITANGLCCEACWREQQSIALAEADRQTQRSGVVAVGGVLLGVAAAMLGASAGSQSSGPALATR
jgi:Zn-finger nucleic acid-binding protein